jgi:hypothetical protein
MEQTSKKHNRLIVILATVAIIFLVLLAGYNYYYYTSFDESAYEVPALTISHKPTGTEDIDADIRAADQGQADFTEIDQAFVQ